MVKLMDEIKYDLSFLKSHTLQPQWYKVLKVFLLIGLLVGYIILFGPQAALLFFSVFFSLGMVIHLAYRIKTNRFTKTWLDFVVVEEGDKVKAKRIGVFYYFGVGISLALSFVLSQLLT